MAINANNILAGVGAGGTSGAELAWFAPLGVVAPTDSTTALTSSATAAQTITITGTPTGGTFTLSFGGATTAGIAFGATAATVQAALQALASIGSGNVVVTGGPGPGTPYVATFAGLLAGMPQSTMTAAGTFTGGTTPAIAVTSTTPGAFGFVSPGLVSQDGIENGIKENANDINAYGLATPVRKIVTSSEVTFKVTFLETNEVALAVYSRLPLVGTGAITVTGGAFTVTEGTFRAQRYAFVQDVVDGSRHVRYFAPNVEVTDRDSSSVKAGEVISSGLTMTAYPGSDGVAVAKFFLIPGLT